MTKFFEQRLDEENIKSKKIAWFAFFIMTLVTLCLTFAVVNMLPLKRTEVKVLVVDKNTGLPTEITALANFENGNVKQMTGIQALNKYFTQQYVIAHDSYNFYQIRDAYSTVMMYSTPSVFEDYKRKFGGEVNIEKKLGTHSSMEVVIHSISQEDIPTPFKDKDDGGVTMRIRADKQIRTGNSINGKQSGTILMTFGYDANLDMDEKARNLNPLGFTVTSYRWTPDMEGQN